MSDQPDRWLITLTPVTTGAWASVPPGRRVAMLLKIALRRCGLRAVAVGPAPPAAPAAPGPRQAPADDSRAG